VAFRRSPPRCARYSPESRAVDEPYHTPGSRDQDPVIAVASREVCFIGLLSYMVGHARCT